MQHDETLHCFVRVSLRSIYFLEISHGWVFLKDGMCSTVETPRKEILGEFQSSAILELSLEWSWKTGWRKQQQAGRHGKGTKEMGSWSDRCGWRSPLPSSVAICFFWAMIYQDEWEWQGQPSFQVLYIYIYVFFCSVSCIFTQVRECIYGKNITFVYCPIILIHILCPI